MAIGALTLEKVQQLCAERDQPEDDVEELKRATPKSLWCKDLDALTNELDTSLQDRLEACNHDLWADQSAIEDQGSKQHSSTEDF